jgi:uncharacterized membrane protein
VLQLFAAASLWFLLHRGVAGSGARGWLVQRCGERGFRALFSLLSLATLVFLVSSYRSAPSFPLWVAPRAMLRIPSFLMPLAFTLLAGAFTAPNPTLIGGAALSARLSARGVQRITRHPFLWAVALWAGTHLLVTGNAGALLFFGSMLLTAVIGAFDIDRKQREREPLGFDAYRQNTSNVPFVAILAGRNRLAFRELLVPGAIGVALSAALLGFHGYLFGVAALP